ncbi:MAG: hypothetical protein WCD18_04185 [Thermosynechococcaceae cyanobacterium]
MKAIAITACLSLLATFTTLWNAQASSIQQRFTQLSSPMTANLQSTQQVTPVPTPESQTETMPVPQASQPQPSPQDPRRSSQDPCPACGMG